MATTSNRIQVRPQLLTWACERAGHPVDAYFSKFPHLEAWISRRTTPTLKQLERFARATHAPIGYFFLREPPSEPMPLPDFRTVAGRPVKRPSPDLLDTVYICQQRQEWYRDYARSLREEPLPFVGKWRTKDDVVAAAADIRVALRFDLVARSKMGTWADALRSFIEQADAAGIMVMCSGVVLNNNKRRLDPEEFRGFAMSDALAPLVFINGADTKAAQMFTLAHELAHIWLGQSALSEAGIVHLPTHEVERWCNQVAAEMLVPMSAFGDEYRPNDDLRSELDRLARRFKVSTLVILRRMYDAGGISKRVLGEQYATELERLRSIPKGGGGNFYLTQSARVSKRFARALIASTLEGHTLHRDALRMLGFSKISTFQQLGESLGVAG